MTVKQGLVDLDRRFDELLEAGDPFEPELQKMMRFKIRRVLIVASIYDYFLLEEDGRLVDLLGEAYKDYDLGYVPVLHRVNDAESAINELKQDNFDLVISVMRLKDMDPFALGRRIKRMKEGMPVVLLAYNTPELQKVIEKQDPAAIDRIFTWQGDGKIIIGIIKYIEDLKNSESDTELAHVQNIILIEDSIQFYSTYLHIIYEELWKQIKHLLQYTLTYTQKKGRQRKRPRIHLATTYEEGKELYEKYKDHLMGLITDLRFPKDGELDEEAGRKFAEMAREEFPYLPILIQSSEADIKHVAEKIGAGFLNKRSPTLIEDFRNILLNFFYFGDIIFKNSSGEEIARTSNLESLYSALDKIPGDILIKYLRSGEVSRWLKARTDIRLAEKIERISLNEGDVEETRHLVRDMIKRYRQQTHRGSVIDYDQELFKEYSQFSRIGEGSLGGKARGLAFIDRSLDAFQAMDFFEKINISIPTTLVIATDMFDLFTHRNELLQIAVSEDISDEEITAKFQQAELPEEMIPDLKDFLQKMDAPLAVRSSSLLEDSLYQPFAGIYATLMIPNNSSDFEDRFNDLKSAIKFVYASTFFKQAKSYIKNSSHRIEDEKMAVILQNVVGRLHGDRFYPDFSGVARSYNYYPAANAKPEDGIINIAIGLGKTVVDGEVSLRYTPEYPEILPQFASVDDMLNYSQKEFWAIDMNIKGRVEIDNEDRFLKKFDLQNAEEDGTLNFTGSTYSVQNDRVYDGIARDGPRIVTFAHILKNEVFPLSDILKMLLKLGEHAMGCPVEIEFSVLLDPKKALPAEFGFLQIRPIVGKEELIDIDFGRYAEESMLCRSTMALGNGIIEDIHDIICIIPDKFDAAKSVKMAAEVAKLNHKLRKEGKKSILIGPGRWGSSEPWLGIPVNWDQIDTAGIIVEASLPNMNPDPSQGSHFFQNITSLRMGYLTVPLSENENFIDWDWLQSQSSEEELEFVKHIKSDSPVKIMIDGRKGKGLILKPDIKGIVDRVFPI